MLLAVSSCVWLVLLRWYHWMQLIESLVLLSLELHSILILLRWSLSGYSSRGYWSSSIDKLAAFVNVVRRLNLADRHRYTVIVSQNHRGWRYLLCLVQWRSGSAVDWLSVGVMAWLVLSSGKRYVVSPFVHLMSATWSLILLKEKLESVLVTSSNLAVKDRWLLVCLVLKDRKIARLLCRLGLLLGGSVLMLVQLLTAFKRDIVLIRATIRGESLRCIDCRAVGAEDAGYYTDPLIDHPWFIGCHARLTALQLSVSGTHLLLLIGLRVVNYHWPKLWSDIHR